MPVKEASWTGEVEVGVEPTFIYIFLHPYHDDRLLKSKHVIRARVTGKVTPIPMHKDLPVTPTSIRIEYLGKSGSYKKIFEDTFTKESKEFDTDITLDFSGFGVNVLKATTWHGPSGWIDVPLKAFKLEIKIWVSYEV